jgi:hypothetical protein
MNGLLMIGLTITCIVSIASALVSMLIDLLTDTSSPPFIPVGDADNNHPRTESEALTNEH